MGALGQLVVLPPLSFLGRSGECGQPVRVDGNLLIALCPV